MLFNHLLLAATAMLGAVVPSAIARPSSTAPPANALVVRQTSPRSGEYSSISAAISALGTTGTAAKSIFIYAGTYKEQVSVTHVGEGLANLSLTTGHHQLPWISHHHRTDQRVSLGPPSAVCRPLMRVLSQSHHLQVQSCDHHQQSRS